MWASRKPSLEEQKCPPVCRRLSFVKGAPPMDGWTLSVCSASKVRFVIFALENFQPVKYLLPLAMLKCYQYHRWWGR